MSLTDSSPGSMQVQVPAQWLVSKTLPIFKNKGDKKDIKNYRPISNLCSSSKKFEKLILKRILEIQREQDVDRTGSSQHGFLTIICQAHLLANLLTVCMYRQFSCRLSCRS